MGIIYIKFVIIAFFPLSITEYVNPQKSEIARHTGCIKKHEKPITSKKYVKFTMG